MNEVKIDVGELDEMIKLEVGPDLTALISDTIMGVDTVIKNRFPDNPNKSIFTSEETLEIIMISSDELSQMSQKWAPLLSAEHQDDPAVYTRKDITVIAVMMSLSAKGKEEGDHTVLFDKLMKLG